MTASASFLKFAADWLAPLRVLCGSIALQESRLTMQTGCISEDKNPRKLCFGGDFLPHTIIVLLSARYVDALSWFRLVSRKKWHE